MGGRKLEDVESAAIQQLCKWRERRWNAPTKDESGKLGKQTMEKKKKARVMRLPAVFH